ncbi:DUF6783 domain-containing protein [Blautia faecis]
MTIFRHRVCTGDWCADCGIFHPNCDAHLAESLFQTHSKA